jgi:hypothetical protein
MHEHIVEELISKPRANAAPSCRRGKHVARAGRSRCALRSADIQRGREPNQTFPAHTAHRWGGEGVCQ